MWQNFNRNAYRYTKHAFVQRDINRLVFAWLIKYGYFCKNSSRILNIGSGTGFFEQNIIKALQCGHLRGVKVIKSIDPSANMCKILATKLGKVAKPIFSIQNTNFESLTAKKPYNYNIITSSMAMQWCGNLSSAVCKAQKMGDRVLICIPTRFDFAQSLFHPLPSRSDIRAICLKYGLQCNFVSKKYHYKNPIDFFTSIKKIGANKPYTHKGNDEQLQNAIVLRQLARNTQNGNFVVKWNLAIITSPIKL